MKQILQTIQTIHNDRSPVMAFIICTNVSPKLSTKKQGFMKQLKEKYNGDFESHKELVPMQPGDVPTTYADTSALEADFGFKPSTSLREGLRKFAEWYVSDKNPMR